MEDTTKQLGHVHIADYTESKFVTPQSVMYELDGKPKKWCATAAYMPARCLQDYYANDNLCAHRTPCAQLTDAHLSVSALATRCKIARYKSMPIACRDVVKAHDSVAVVLYHKDKNCMLLVRQFRPALYGTLLRGRGITDTRQAGADAPDLTAAFTCELCAGIVDKDMSLKETVREEVLEECGFDVPLSHVQQLTTFVASVGSQGSFQTLFFAQVDSTMKVTGSGGGVHADGEAIELLGLPLENIDAFLMDADVPKTSGAMFGLLWAKSHILQHV